MHLVCYSGEMHATFQAFLISQMDGNVWSFPSFNPRHRPRDTTQRRAYDGVEKHAERIYPTASLSAAELTRPPSQSSNSLIDCSLNRIIILYTIAINHDMMLTGFPLRQIIVTHLKFMTVYEARRYKSEGRGSDSQ